MRVVLTVVAKLKDYVRLIPGLDHRVVRAPNRIWNLASTKRPLSFPNLNEDKNPIF
jgi:hypothetical protein